MIHPRCPCRHPDARECLARRLGVSCVGFDRFELEVVGLGPDDRCECSCHSKDQDGFDGWDDPRDGRDMESPE